ncbi:hypothetical protein C8Q80DRAFT_376743 [Daedaleopsis nitida]|nr:hypothetical protein C8Q80DRAFT_376743 [Daedaleopsis nitida]
MDRLDSCQLLPPAMTSKMKAALTSMAVPVVTDHAGSAASESRISPTSIGVPDSRGYSRPSDLNLDVIRTILTFCHITDLLQISVASIQMREAAKREIVSRPVTLYGANASRHSAASCFLMATTHSSRSSTHSV